MNSPSANRTSHDGLTNASGDFLDGAASGQQGSDYVATFSREVLATPLPRVEPRGHLSRLREFIAQRRAAWSSRFQLA